MDFAAAPTAAIATTRSPRAINTVTVSVTGFAKEVSSFFIDRLEGVSPPELVGAASPGRAARFA